MNISTINASDTMDVLSTTKIPAKKDASTNTAQSFKDPTSAASADRNKEMKNAPLIKKEDESGKSKPSSMEDLKKIAKELNDHMDDLQTSLGFSVNEDPEKEDQVIVQIRDRKTNEVIRQIPTEELQKIKEKMTELTGLLLDQHA